jgi:Transposase IS116/IS110/IS902 family
MRDLLDCVWPAALDTAQQPFRSRTWIAALSVILDRHAGLAPREKLSGTFVGRTKLTGQGRPGLRLAAWRAAWGAQRANPVYAARYRHLTTREHNKLRPPRPKPSSPRRSCGTCTP